MKASAQHPKAANHRSLFDGWDLDEPATLGRLKDALQTVAATFESELRTAKADAMASRLIATYALRELVNAAEDPARTLSQLEANLLNTVDNMPMVEAGDPKLFERKRALARQHIVKCVAEVGRVSGLRNLPVQ